MNALIAGLRLNRVWIVALVAAPLLGVGCRYRPDAARRDWVSEAAYPQVTVQGKLRTRIVMAAPTVRDDPGVPMRVTVPVRYVPYSRLFGASHKPAQYRFIFLEDDGTPMDSNPAWKYIDLPARTQVFLTGSAMDPSAGDWRCEIRPNAEERDRERLLD